MRIQRYIEADCMKQCMKSVDGDEVLARMMATSAKGTHENSMSCLRYLLKALTHDYLEEIP